MKKFILGIILGISISVIAADVTLPIVIPDAYVTRAITALTACKGTYVNMMFQGSHDPNKPNEPDFNLNVNFRIESIKGEKNADYGKRFVNTILLNIVKAYEEQQRQETINQNYKKLIEETPKVNVPKDIFK